MPRFLLRRFAIPVGDDAGLIWRGGLADGVIRRVAPKFEAARRHYYALPIELELPDGYAEDVLARVEASASGAIAAFERNTTLDLEERHALALFLLLQHRRTPTGRRELRFMDEFLARMYGEMRLSDRDVVRAALARVEGREPTAAEVAEWQRERLAEIRGGDVVFESTSEREVGLMFSNLDTIVPELVLGFDWMFLRVPDGISEIVLPDVGLTVFDPTPRFPEAGTGFKSSPSSETILYLDRRLVLMLRPGDGYGSWGWATERDVELMNVRAVACSDRCIYGASENAVAETLALADADWDRIASLRPRPPTFWIAQFEGEPTAGPTTFVGHSRTGTVERKLHISEEGIRESRANGFTLDADARDPPDEKTAS